MINMTESQHQAPGTGPAAEDNHRPSKHALTPFQWRVLKVVMDIPLGETRTYKWVAQKVGSPDAVRAVGQALRRNPYPLTIPCHRVIKSDGSLGAYAGKMDGRKERLLAQERDIVSRFRVVSGE